MSKTIERLAQSPLEGPWSEVPPAPPLELAAAPATPGPATPAITQPASSPALPWWQQSQYTLPLLLGALGLALVLWAVWQRVRAKRLSTQTAGAAAGADVVLERELVDLTDQLVHQLDDRTKQLEALLARADKRSAELEAALKDAQQQLRQARQHAAAAQVEAKPVARMGLDSNPHQEIYDLADQGYSPVQIAQRLARHTGQIELILNLRRAGA